MLCIYFQRFDMTADYLTPTLEMKMFFFSYLEFNEFKNQIYFHIPIQPALKIIVGLRGFVKSSLRDSTI